MNKPSLPYLAFAGCALIWGSTFLVIRVGNDTLAPLWACSLRLGLAALVLNLVLLVTGQRWPRGEGLRAAALYGFWEFGLSMPLLYWAEHVVSSGLAAVVFAICPVMAMFAAKGMGLESFSPQRLGAALIAFAGVGIIFWREFIHGGSPAGLVAIFLAAATAPIAGLTLQRGPRQSAIANNAIGSLVGFASSLVFSFVLRETHPLPTSVPQLVPVVYLALAGSAGAFVMFAWLVQRWPATTVAFIGVVIPVIAVVLGAVARNEAFAPGSLGGAIVVLAGVAVVLKAPTAVKPAEA
ncbi:MAG TPA: EamA family transporter [Fimbriimonadaceae bacterium]|nr:EamA family transporter [Fimbriimonadaceae bacterium]